MAPRFGWEADNLVFVDAQTGWQVGDVPGVLPTPGGPIGERVVVYRTVDGGRSWSTVADRPAPNRGHLAFVSRAAAVIVFDGLRDVLSTSDGGASWAAGQFPDTSADRSSYGPPYTPFFVSPTEGWVLGRRAQPNGKPDGVLYHTSDGGVTWSPISSLDSLPQIGTPGLMFESPSIGVLDMDSQAWPVPLMTTDGGRSWHQLPMPRQPLTVPTGPQPYFIPDGFQVRAVPGWASTGWTEPGIAGSLFIVVTERWRRPGGGSPYLVGHLYQLSSSGDGWIPRSLPTGESLQDQIAEQQGLPWMRQLGPRHFLALSEPRTVSMEEPGPRPPRDFVPTLYRSDDGGKSWSLALIHPPGGVEGGTYQFSSPDVGWMVTGGPAVKHLMKTSDGGRTWTSVAVPSWPSLFA